MGSSGAQGLPMWSFVTECAYLILHLHICSDWLQIKTNGEFCIGYSDETSIGMWVVMGTSILNDAYFRLPEGHFSTTWISDRWKDRFSKLLISDP